MALIILILQREKGNDVTAYLLAFPAQFAADIEVTEPAYSTMPRSWDMKVQPGQVLIRQVPGKSVQDLPAILGVSSQVPNSPSLCGPANL